MRWFLLLLCIPGSLLAQLPFYTDDPAVTEPGKWHYEFFNEYDVLHLQFPNIRQNTSNSELNYGLPHNLEIDVDLPYLAIFRAAENPNAAGVGDLDMGIKWEFHKEKPRSRVPALGVSLYIEFPRDATRQLGSGLSDFCLTSIVPKSLSDKTRVNGNLGTYLPATPAPAWWG